MAKYSIGLTSLKLGAIAGDGGMGTTLVALGNTVADSCVLATEEGQTQEFKIEEQDDPVMTVQSEKGKTTLTWSSYDVDADILLKLFGGSVAAGPPKVWSAPDSVPILEQSIEIVPKSGGKIEIVRAQVIAKLQWNLNKTRLAQIDIVATVLAPTKAATPSMKITNPS
jgi:hypothetical protein